MRSATALSGVRLGALALTVGLLFIHCAAEGTLAEVVLPVLAPPPVDPTVPSSLLHQTRFLYTGANPVQSGVAPDTIDERRACVLRGVLKDKSGAPLPGVRVTIKDHPELGRTLSRADGAYDLAVNGGDRLVVAFQKPGLLTARRQVQSAWQRYVQVPAVVMIPPDEHPTTVVLGSTGGDSRGAGAAIDPAGSGVASRRAQALTVDPSAPTGGMQLARGSVVSDAFGARQATVLFPPGTEAWLVFADHSEPLASLHLHASEFTVGPSGPAAMPATLPQNSGYTYAVDLSVQEAIDRDAKGVRFNQPVLFYLENYLHFRVGTTIPAGFLDEDRALWTADDNGRVVKILAVHDGTVELDGDGDGVAESAAALAALHVTAEERARLATLYSAGQTLWRVPLTHFTAWDLNLLLQAIPEAIAPPLKPHLKERQDNPDIQCGCVIEVQNQILGQAFPITGTPFSLHYSSDRTPGYAANRVLDIPILPDPMPYGVQAVELEMNVAGQFFTQRFGPIDLTRWVGHSYSHSWNGLDGYGRPTPRGLVSLRLGYVYEGIYTATPRFGMVWGGGGGGGGATSNVSVVDATAIQGAPNREAVLWSEWQGVLGSIDDRGRGLGGFSLSVHHQYDPVARTLYLGDGTRRSDVNGSASVRVVSDHQAENVGDGTAAPNLALGRPLSGSCRRTAPWRWWPAPASRARRATGARRPRRSSRTRGAWWARRTAASISWTTTASVA